MINLAKSRQSGNPYNDNLCFFRCLALLNTNNPFGLEREVQHLVDAYRRELGEVGANGITMNDLDVAERLYRVNIQVYSFVVVEKDGRDDGENFNEDGESGEDSE